MKHIQSFRDFLNESMLKENQFAEGEFVRWSNPKGQSGTPTLYGVVAKDRGSKVDLTILATSGKDDTQPTQRYSDWSGGRNVSYEGGYSKEDLQGIIDKEGVRSGSGYEKKYLTTWEPA
jgi:hypothetical protein